MILKHAIEWLKAERDRIKKDAQDNLTKKGKEYNQFEGLFLDMQAKTLSKEIIALELEESGPA